MPEVTITVRRKGSLKVEGPFRLIDSEGNEIPLPTNKPAVSLCRCGHSRNKPFCDSSHRDCGWDAPEAHILAREKQEKEKQPAGSAV